MKKNLIVALIALTAAWSSQAQTTAYPNRSVRAVLPYSVGSGPDAVARMIGEQLSNAWKQPIIVENKPGANGWLAIGEVKRSAPDGYSIAVVDNTHMTLQPHLYSKMPFDPVKDFIPVAPIYTTNFFIVVAADSPWKSVADLVEAARKAPGTLTYGSWGIGSVAHIGSTLFQQKTQTSMTHVPYKELPQLYTAVANGEISWAFGTAATVQNLYQAKRVRLLALAAPQRLKLYPDVPTVSEAGGPEDFTLKTWVAAFVPKGTPPQVTQEIGSSVARALTAPALQERFRTFGFELWPTDAAGVASAQEQDSAHYAEVVKQANISLD